MLILPIFISGGTAEWETFGWANSGVCALKPPSPSLVSVARGRAVPYASAMLGRCWKQRCTRRPTSTSIVCRLVLSRGCVGFLPFGVESKIKTLIVRRRFPLFLLLYRYTTVTHVVAEVEKSAEEKPEPADTQAGQGDPAPHTSTDDDNMTCRICLSAYKVRRESKREKEVGGGSQGGAGERRAVEGAGAKGERRRGGGNEGRKGRPRCSGRCFL